MKSEEGKMTSSLDHTDLTDSDIIRSIIHIYHPFTSTALMDSDQYTRTQKKRNENVQGATSQVEEGGAGVRCGYPSHLFCCTPSVPTWSPDLDGLIELVSNRWKDEMMMMINSGKPRYTQAHQKFFKKKYAIPQHDTTSKELVLSSSFCSLLPKSNNHNQEIHQSWCVYISRPFINTGKRREKRECSSQKFRVLEQERAS